MVRSGREHNEATFQGIAINRPGWLILIYFLIAGAIMARLFFLQVLSYRQYTDQAAGLRSLTLEVPAPRGDIILTKSGTAKELLIAISQTKYMAVADPFLIKDYLDLSPRLAEILVLDKDELQKKISNPKDRYEVLAHGVSLEQKEKVEALASKGIFFQDEPTRWYPEKELFAHLTGFVGFKDDKLVGSYGVEEFFDQDLRGLAGQIQGERDPSGQLIPTSNLIIGPGEKGASLVLTIDRSAQFFVCEALKAYVKKFSATGGTVIIQESATGKIIALCNVPTFDPNNYRQAELNSFMDPAISFQYEPGSVFKPLTMAMALDLKKITPESTFEDTGVVVIGRERIQNSDFKANGIQTMTQVLEKSLNTGAVFVQRQVGREAFTKYVKAFGFGEPTGITLPAEISGDIDSLEEPKEIYAATASFGQGIATTPLQIVNAFSALANGGKLMQPYLVAEKRLASGVVITTPPRVIRQVIEPETSQLITAMLVAVVDNGHGKRAGVKGYYVAGKTGTAQIPLSGGGGYEVGANIGNFVGFLPADQPRFTMITKIDRPQGVEFAESSAAPLFGDIASFLVNYYKIPPTR